MNACLSSVPDMPNQWAANVPVQSGPRLRKLVRHGWMQSNADLPGMYLIRLRHHMAASRKRGLLRESNFAALK